MTRITMKALELLATQINKAAGTPLTYCDTVGKAPFKANINHYYIDAAYSGVKLVQICNEGGGIRAVTRSGYTAKRELYREMTGILTGIHMRAEK